MPRPKGSKNKKTLERESASKKLFGATIEYDTGEYVTKKFTGRSSCGLEHNHVYVVKLEKSLPYGYSVSVIYDKTRSEETDCLYRVSNEQMFRHFFI